MNKLLTLTVAALTLLTSACGPQAFVQVDTAAEGSFTIADDAPLTRPVPGGLVVVLAEAQDDELALVTVEMPPVEQLAVGEPLDIASAGIAIQASRGDLEIIERRDGARILNSQNTRYFRATGGTFTVDSVEPLAGTFDLVLEDGALSGSFVVR